MTRVNRIQTDQMTVQMFFFILRHETIEKPLKQTKYNLHIEVYQLSRLNETKLEKSTC